MLSVQGTQGERGQAAAVFEEPEERAPDADNGNVTDSSEEEGMLTFDRNRDGSPENEGTEEEQDPDVEEAERQQARNEPEERRRPDAAIMDLFPRAPAQVQSGLPSCLPGSYTTSLLFHFGHARESSQRCAETVQFLKRSCPARSQMPSSFQ